MTRFIFLLIVFSACHQQKTKHDFTDVVHIPPSVFVQSDNLQLSYSQDTLLLNTKKFSGWLYQTHESDTVLLESYINGLKEGYSKKWYSNKQLAEERLYIAGRKEGTHYAWWPNGNKQYLFTIRNDEYQGEFSEWNSEGSLIKLFHYKNGHEEGSQQLWYDNGKTRANYVIANGRRYGLLGTKNCTNVSDSVFKK